MKRLALFPSYWKFIALLLLAGSIALSIANDKYNFEFSWLSYPKVHHNDIFNNNLTDEVWLTGLVGSLLILCFCKERIEDEYVQAIRLHAWQWAVVTNYLLFMIATWTVYGLQFLGIVMYNVLTPLVIYLLIFYTRLYVLPRFNRKTAL
jgi:hypothetical protein